MDGTLSGSIKKALGPKAEALMVAIDATESIDELVQNLAIYPPSAYHLGQAVLGSMLIQAMSDTDDHERYDLQWKIEGPFGNLVAEALDTGKYRASIAKTQTAEDTFGKPLGDGILQVRRSNKDGKQVASGLIETLGTVAEDLTDYLERSEQKKCALALYVNIDWDESRGKEFPFKVKKAIGYLVHILPADSEAKQDVTVAMWDKHLKDLGPMSNWELPEDPDKATSAIFSFLTGLPENPITYSSQIQQNCPCSESRIFRAVELLTNSEKKWILNGPEEQQKKESLEVECEFCGQVYEISKDDFIKAKSKKMKI